MTRILLHSSDTKMYSLLAAALRPECAIALESDLAEVRKRVSDGQADVLVLEFDTNCSSLEQQLSLYDQLSDCPVPVVVMTNDVRRSTAIEFMQRGAVDCVRKPPSLGEFKVVVGRAHERSLMRAELDKRRHGTPVPSCGDLVGSSGRAQVVYDVIHRVARLNTPVLITGESGTGKELVARAIHNLGSRAPHPFIAVACGAIPETLIESELFGHERGAFTGSTGARVGYLEAAGEGTLFLDELGELSLNTQVKLLRVLQQREFSRLGSNRLIPLKARVLFATHRNLQEMTETGSFRKDLFYRVTVMDIQLPPLRERTEDIPSLARHFLSRYSEEYGKPACEIRPNVMELLVEYDWPGNVRELENVIQYAVIRADGEEICRGDLPDHLQPLTPAVVQDGDSTHFEKRLRQFKVDLVNTTLEQCGGNKTLAAQTLGLSRAYLHRLLRLGSSSKGLELVRTA